MTKLLALCLAGLLLMQPASAAEDGFAGAVRVGSNYRVVGNQTYVTANGRDLKLDVYVPYEPPPSMPVLLLIHGGGWVVDTRESTSLTALPYMQMGFAVVNIDYRLAREALAPAAVEDALCALQWIGHNAKRYKFDLSKVVVTGNSAGGHLALTTGMLPADSVYANQCAPSEGSWSGPYQSAAPKVAAIVNWYGITDVAELLQGPTTRSYAVGWFGSLPGRMELARGLSPVYLAKAGGPPVLTIHGDQDAVVPYAQAVRLQQALDKAGIRHELLTIKGGGHGGLPLADELLAFNTIRRFLREQGIVPAPP